MDAMRQLAWSCAPGLIVGVVLAVWNARQKRLEEERKAEAKRMEHERREAENARVKSETLRIALVVATAKLSYAVAMAVKRGHPNGEIEEGIEAYNQSLEQFREFEREQLVRNTEI